MSTPRRPAPRSRVAPMIATACAFSSACIRARLALPNMTPPTGPAASPIRVLVADDDPSFRSSVCDLIERQPGLDVVATAADGLRAIELADDLDPDAVVIDVHMPLLDGVSATARLRHDHPNLCLIALTGDQEPAIHNAVLE